MPRAHRWTWVFGCALLVPCLVTADASAQLPRPGERAREFAPGVLTVIPAEIEAEETTSVHPLVELRADKRLDWTPELSAPTRTLYERASLARFRRDVWRLEFAYKPLRMIYVDVPQASGATERKLVWYLVYRVRNTGTGLAPREERGDAISLYATKPTKVGPVRFVPHLVLEAHDVDAAGDKVYRAYLDQVIPAAVEPIRRRELEGRRLMTSTEIAAEKLPPSTPDAEGGVWGVAMWEGVDPKIDFFSVYVRGLTNAYQWTDPAGAYQAGDPPGSGRVFVRKTLKLNFWRPGDQYLPHESEVRNGVAPGKGSLYGDGASEGVAYQWVYR